MAINYVDPISRIEGHLGVDLTWDDSVGGTGLVTEANVHGNLWRGFENFLIGREPNDAITFTQRICGVCPVPHGQAATFAVEAAMGYNDNFHTYHTSAYTDGKGIPEKAIHIRNLILSSEFLMSSITHFYHLAAPSYVQGPNTPPWTPYFADAYYVGALQSGGRVLPVEVEGFSDNVWSAVIKSYVHALRIRRLTFEAGALFAGRMPMTSSFIAGGVTNDAGEDLTSKVEKFKLLTEEVGRFVIQEYVPISLALGFLYPGYDNTYNGGSGYGAGCGNMLAWGAFPQMTTNDLAISRGFLPKADLLNNDPATTIEVADVLTNLREHIKYSRYAGASSAVDNAGVPNPADVTDPASETRTIPKRDDATKYSWMKAPRWIDAPAEVGPMARMFVMTVFEDNVGLATSAASAKLGIAGYDAYVKGAPDAATTGLDPAMIAADIAVALVRAGLAAVRVGTDMYGVDTAATQAAGWGVDLGLTWNALTAATPQATLEGVYTDPAAVIVDPSGVATAGGLVYYIYTMKSGLSTMDRLRGRAIESLFLVQKMVGAYNKAADTFAGGWCAQLGSATGATYVNKAYPVGETFGFGGHEAPRGALMHMCTQEAGKITAYQCIVPTTWNGSPKDVAGVRGPIEEAMIGIPYATDTKTIRNQANTDDIVTEGGVEALRVAQSFDPCIACAIH